VSEFLKLDALDGRVAFEHVELLAPVALVVLVVIERRLDRDRRLGLEKNSKV
jgi:hypothetical protein